LCALLERSGCQASPQRVYRIYTEEHLAVRRLKRSDARAGLDHQPAWEAGCDSMR